MFICDPKRGIEPRMSDQEIHSYLEDVSDMVECRKFYEDTGDKYYLTRLRTLHDSLRRRVEYAFKNHTRPMRCTCGEYPSVKTIDVMWEDFRGRRGIDKDQYRLKCICGMSSDHRRTINEAVIAWNSMITEERRNGKGRNRITTSNNGLSRR
jgi:hypothetical protein